MGRWQRFGVSVLGHHQHQKAYAAIVLSGGYEEAGDCGRFYVEAGNVILHDRFEGHLNRFCSGATVLNISLPVDSCIVPGVAQLEDADLVVRASEVNDGEALAILLTSTRRANPRSPMDWPDMLARDIVRETSLSLSRWSELNGLTPWAVSRGFTQVFGITPSVFRRRARARHAWHGIERSEKGLATLSAEIGFADQPHMSRDIKMLTGQSPAKLRSRANDFKTQNS